MDHFFDLTNEPQCIISPNGLFKKVNLALCKTLQCTREELENHSFVEYVFPEDRETTQKKMFLLSPQACFINRCTTKNGEIRIISWKMCSIADLIYAVGQDLTVLRNQQKQQIALEKELESNYQEKETFIHAVSHNLKNAVFSIQGFFELFKYSIQNQCWDSALSDILLAEKSLQQMNHVIDNFGRQVLCEDEYLALNEIFETAVERCKLARSRQATIEIPPQQIFIPCQKKQMVEAVYNIIENAIKFTDPDVTPKISVEFTEEPTSVLCSVKDNGIGIKEHCKNKVFEPFFQIDYMAPGIGIGLSVAKGIIEKHHGKIWLEDNVPHGTIVFISFVKEII